MHRHRHRQLIFQYVLRLLHNIVSSDLVLTDLSPIVVKEIQELSVRANSQVTDLSVCDSQAQSSTYMRTIGVQTDLSGKGRFWQLLAVFNLIFIIQYLQYVQYYRRSRCPP